MPANLSTLGTQVSSKAKQVQSQLQISFRTPFTIWQLQLGIWTRVENESDSEEATLPCELLPLFEQLTDEKPTTPQIATIGNGNCYVAFLCADDDQQDVVIAGQVELDPALLVQQLAAGAVQQAILQVECETQQPLLDEYASRLIDSYEELTFLRKLTRHVEYCDVSRSLADVAQTVLPDLLNLMGIEGIGLIEAKWESKTNRPHATSLLQIHGELAPNEIFWCDYVNKLESKPAKVQVKNYFGLMKTAEQSPMESLRSLVIAPVMKDGVIFGWLLGVNKRPPYRNKVDPLNCLGHDEIGSMEATLLEAAALMLGSHAANSQLFREKENLVVDVIHTLVGVIEAKDAYTCGHSDRVALISKRLGSELGLSGADCQDIYLSGLLHDIGKVGIADDVLLKPGMLSAQEFDQIKQHPQTGANLLKGLRPLEKLIPGVLHHHEAVDGSGYPYGLWGDQIPLMARIMAVADAFDAMTSDRPYRKGMPLEKAETILRAGVGNQWDTQVVAAYFRAQSDISKIGTQWRDHLDSILGGRSQDHDSICNERTASTAEFTAMKTVIAPIAMATNHSVMAGV